MKRHLKTNAKLAALIVLWWLCWGGTPVLACQYEFCWDWCDANTPCDTVCTMDCGSPSTCGDFGTCYRCGDGYCDRNGGENGCNCPQDCQSCGDGICDFCQGVGPENFLNCSTDCGACGDGICGTPPSGGGVTNGEGSCSCPQDCGSAGYCSGSGGSCPSSCFEAGDCAPCQLATGNTYACLDHVCMPAH
jgi:hypothetical protein